MPVRGESVYSLQGLQSPMENFKDCKNPAPETLGEHSTNVLPRENIFITKFLKEEIGCYED